MEVTDEGIVTEARELQPEKAFNPMEVTDEGIVTEVRELHLSKALPSMLVPDDIVTLASLEHVKIVDVAN